MGRAFGRYLAIKGMAYGALGCCWWIADPAHPLWAAVVLGFALAYLGCGTLLAVLAESRGKGKQC